MIIMDQNDYDLLFRGIDYRIGLDEKIARFKDDIKFSMKHHGNNITVKNIEDIYTPFILENFNSVFIKDCNISMPSENDIINDTRNSRINEDIRNYYKACIFLRGIHDTMIENCIIEHPIILKELDRNNKGLYCVVNLQNDIIDTLFVCSNYNITLDLNNTIVRNLIVQDSNVTIYRNMDQTIKNLTLLNSIFKLKTNGLCNGISKTNINNIYCFSSLFDDKEDDEKLYTKSILTDCYYNDDVKDKYKRELYPITFYKGNLNNYDEELYYELQRILISLGYV